MSLTRTFTYGIIFGLLTNCSYSTFNSPTPVQIIPGTGIGLIAGGLATGTVAGGVVGAAAGGAVGAIASIQQESKQHIVHELEKEDIQLVSYGDTMTLIIPTDKYYKVNSPHLKEECVDGLSTVVKLLNYYHGCKIYVAGFTDNVGSTCHKKLLSQAQAESMLTFLWSHELPAELINSVGFADKFTISDNKLIHGSAQNRRVEIQWITSDCH